MSIVYYRRLTAGLMAISLLGTFAVSTGCGGGSSSSDSSSSTETLSTTNTAATQSANAAISSAISSLDSLVYLTNDTASRLKAATRSEFSVANNVTVSRTDTVTTVTVAFGETGVTTYGGRTITGTIIIAWDRTAKTATMTYQNVTINGKSITGTVTASNITVASTGVSGTMTFDLTIGGVGHTVGTVSLSIASDTDIITISGGTFTFTPEGSTTAYTITVSNLVIDPKTNGNFIPESGTMTVAYPVTIGNKTTTTTITITYNENTPSTGTVSVSVNGGTAVDYTLPK